VRYNDFMPKQKAKDGQVYFRIDGPKKLDMGKAAEACGLPLSRYLLLLHEQYSEDLRKKFEVKK
jgi:hypothetical protein